MKPLSGRLIMKKIFTTLGDVVPIRKGGSDKLGEGSFSKVKLVSHRDNPNKLYAMKTIPKKNDKERQLIYKEIKLHMSLSHPNVIRFEDFFEERNEVYIFLEYAKNGDLFTQINRNKIDDGTLLRFFHQTCLAIEYIHSKNIMHRDLKPENILLDDDMNVKICDFGWSTEYFENIPRETLCGTFEYMAPEVILRSKQSKKTDIWALGILLYELFHGSAPFRGNSMDTILEQIKQNRVLFKKNVDSDVKDLVVRILKFYPEDRPNIKQILEHQLFKRLQMAQTETLNSVNSDFFNQKYSTYFSEIQNCVSPTSMTKIDRFIEENAKIESQLSPCMLNSSSNKNFFDTIYQNQEMSASGRLFAKQPPSSQFTSINEEGRSPGNINTNNRGIQIDCKISLNNQGFSNTFLKQKSTTPSRKNSFSNTNANKGAIPLKSPDKVSPNPLSTTPQKTIVASLKHLTPSLQNFQLKPVFPTVNSGRNTPTNPATGINTGQTQVTQAMPSNYISNYGPVMQASPLSKFVDYPKSFEYPKDKSPNLNGKLVQCRSYEQQPPFNKPPNYQTNMAKSTSRSEFTKPMSFVNHQYSARDKHLDRSPYAKLDLGEKTFGNYLMNYAKHG
jgi:serine/threonine protein kinase